MDKREKVIKGLECCSVEQSCLECPWGGKDCNDRLHLAALELLKEQEAERQRLLDWLSKFCQHIDNKDKWLDDAANLAFFKKKMHQQFDWKVGEV